MSSIVADASVAAASNAGDWTCGDSDCRHVNFARRTKCNRCQRERSTERTSGSGSSSGGGGGGSGALSKKKLGTEIGKAAAEKSRGLFSAEDWQCSKCANVNWARRQTCNMCNAPKFCDVEERTGYGGGYNDRGVVEYKEREESDSEYDEFGRLKKRKNAVSQVKVKLESDKIKRTTEEEDDEEDDDDNGDLSKYDLWGDDDEVETSNKTTQKVTSTTDHKKRSSRSSTRSNSATSSRSVSSASSTSSSSGSSTSSSSTSSSSTSSSSSATTTSSVTKIKNEKRSYSRSQSSASHSSTERKKQQNKPSKLHDRNRSRSPLSSHSSSTKYRKRSRSRSISSGKRQR